MSKSVRSAPHTSVNNRPASTAKCTRDKARPRPKRKRGWLYRTFIGDDTDEVEPEKPVAKPVSQPVQELLPPLRQPIVAPQRRFHTSAATSSTSSALPSTRRPTTTTGYDQWPSNNEILYQCVYPAPNRVVTDSMNVISPPLSMEQYLSMYTGDPDRMMPTYAYSQSSGV